MEETGYTAEKLILLTRMYPSPGYTEEVLYIYLALGLTPGETDPDYNEAIDVCEYPLDTLLEMADRGEIEDAKTLAGLLLAKRYLDHNAVK